MTRRRKKCELDHTRGTWIVDKDVYRSPRARCLGPCQEEKDYTEFTYEWSNHKTRGHNDSLCSDCRRLKADGEPTPVPPLSSEQKDWALDLFDMSVAMIRMKLMEGLDQV